MKRLSVRSYYGRAPLSRQAFRKGGGGDVVGTEENGRHRAVLDEMESCNEPLENESYAALLRGCSHRKSVSGGRRVHAHITKFCRDPGTFLCNLIIHMYGSCGKVEEAREVFDRILRKNVYSWNLIIGAYADLGHFEEASRLFETMTRRDHIAWTALMKAFAISGKLDHARELFDRMPGRDTVCWTTLLTANAKNGNLSQAEILFDQMPERTLVSWTALISAYAQEAQGKKSLMLFKRMDLEGLKANDVTFLSVLDACCRPLNLAEGRAIHARIQETEFSSDLKLGNALITMYGKCGSCTDARKAFNTMLTRDFVSWNGMIEAYAQNDMDVVIPDMFRQMQLDGQAPTEITLISVLSACSHAGLVEDGWNFFAALYDFGMTAAADHYVCMADLLGRAGHLEDALDLIQNMPYHPDAVAWRTILSACQVHKELHLTSQAAGPALELGGEHAGSYMLVTNI